jgi:glycosyltransferase involved in cell wall biosynthesis
MRSLRVNIILPFPGTKPGGGLKVMYEYANRLQKRGHHVTVLHSILRPYKKMRSPLWWKKLIYKLRGANRPKWFPLDESIVAVIVPEITNEHVPDGDVLFSTWWEMAFMISRLNEKKGMPFNLIQGYEVWKGNHDLVHESYKLDINHLVIANYLQRIVEEHTGKRVRYLPIAIDTDVFYQQSEPSSRNPCSILMLYSEEPVKGSTFGIEALKEMKKIIPELEVTLFGVDKKPDLPGWITYHQKPADLPGLYNKHAIFFSPSISEGWALPPAEAMACGCALVCTNIGGHLDYAIAEKTALLTEPKNVPDMVAKLHQLVTNQERRIMIARQGRQYLTENFNWKTSVDRLEEYFMTSLTAKQDDTG